MGKADEEAPTAVVPKEVERQCDFAIIALEDVEEAKASSDGKLFLVLRAKPAGRRREDLEAPLAPRFRGDGK